MERIGITSEKCADSYPVLAAHWPFSKETHLGKCNRLLVLPFRHRRVQRRGSSEPIVLGHCMTTLNNDHCGYSHHWDCKWRGEGHGGLWAAAHAQMFLYCWKVYFKKCVLITFKGDTQRMDNAKQVLKKHPLFEYTHRCTHTSYIYIQYSLPLVLRSIEGGCTVSQVLSSLGTTQLHLYLPHCSVRVYFPISHFLSGLTTYYLFSGRLSAYAWQVNKGVRW